MPLQLDASYDPLTPLIRFEKSAVFEMLTGLESVIDPFHHPDWTETVQREMGSEFVAELTELYRDFHDGSIISELGVEAPDPDDIPRFIDHIASMEIVRFVFYVLGRLQPIERLPNPITRAGIEELMRDLSGEHGAKYANMPLGWTDDPEALRTRLVGLWRNYWERFFRFHAKDHVACAEASIRERQETLAQRGGTALYEQITGWKELPSPIPADQSYRELILVPIYRIPRKRVIYFGYGSVTVLYDCTRNEQLERSIELGKERALAVMRALADETRLAVLRMIAQHPYSNGRKIAEQVKLSPSVVSRHLKQLKDAGLIEEHSPDNRNITYRLVYDAISSVPESIMRYIKD